MWRFLFFSLCLLLSVQQTGSRQARPNETRTAKADAAVQVCRDKIYSVLGSAPLISPQGIHVTVPEKDVEAALARGFQMDREAVLAGIRAYDDKKPSPEQVTMAKFSDEELNALLSDIMVCTRKQRDVLSREDLVQYGLAMAEIASATKYSASSTGRCNTIQCVDSTVLPREK